MSDDLIKIEVDGKSVSAKKGQMIIEATDQHGAYVPRFCYHTKLSIAANCRMCLVEVEKAPKPLPACATPIAEGVMDFHNDLMFVVVFVGIFVGYVLVRCVQLYSSDINPVPNRVQHGTVLEIVWTITPALILMCVAFPSFALLYSIDEILDPAVTLKVVGHQWYWSYEYSDYSSEDGETINFDTS